MLPPNSSPNISVKNTSSRIHRLVLFCVTCLSINATNVQDGKDVQVILIGDSVLDNFYWLKKPKENNTLALLKKNGWHNPLSFAVDESKVDDVTNGFTPAQTYVESRRIYDMKPYERENDGKVHPLRLLKKYIQKNAKGAKKKQLVVISVGGNDLVLNDASSAKQVQDIIQGSEKNKGLLERYNTLLQEIKKISTDIHVALVIPYCPLFPDFFSSNFNTAKAQNETDWIKLMHGFVQVITKAAESHGCDIIDLSHTFNPYDRNEYGFLPNTNTHTPIEPSDTSVPYIIDLIEYLLQEKPSHKSPSIYYGKKGKFHVEKNNDAFRKGYPQSLQNHFNASRSKPFINRYTLAIAAIPLTMIGALSLWYYLRYQAKKGRATTGQPPASTKGSVYNL